jgi:hypothetical protein
MPASRPQKPSPPSSVQGIADPAPDPAPSQRDKDNSFQLHLADKQHSYYLQRNYQMLFAFFLFSFAIIFWTYFNAEGGPCPDPSKEFLETITNHITDIFTQNPKQSRLRNTEGYPRTGN